MRKIIILLSVLFGPFIKAGAQNITIANLSWNIKRTDYVGSGVFDEPGGSLVSYGNTRVEWRDNSGSLKQTFTIQETNGTWNNVATNGTILYEAENNGNECTVTFVRDGSVLRATIIVLPNNEQPLIYEFTLQNLTTL